MKLFLECTSSGEKLLIYCVKVAFFNGTLVCYDTENVKHYFELSKYEFLVSL